VRYTSCLPEWRR